jgi:tRNA threonylcarbamoyladenosine biosynthesis protein TsaB
MLIPLIEKSLNEAGIWYQDLDLISSIKGPGNFTGIRIGFSVAKIIKMATNIPLIMFSTLEAIAYNYLDKWKDDLIVILDAKLDELFIQTFDANSLFSNKFGESLNNNSEPSSEPKLIQRGDINKYITQNNPLIVGSGKEIARNIISDKAIKISSQDEDDHIKASNIALMAAKIYSQKNYKEQENKILYVREASIYKSKSRPKSSAKPDGK